MPATISLKDPTKFFLPLIFTAEMVMISHSIIHANLARLPNPEVVLAGYSVAFSFFSALGSPVWTSQFIALAFIKDKASVKLMLRFIGIILAGILAVVCLIVFTPLAAWLFGGVFGASPAAVAEARVTLFVMFWGLPFAALRGMFYALIMRRRVTLLITAGTALRLGALAGYLVLLRYALEGAVIGAAALALCMFTEFLWCFITARRFYRELPAEEGPRDNLLAVWLFSWPLMINGLTESGVSVVINFFLGRLANADLALASFGVMWGITMVMMSPLRNLIQTTQSLVNQEEDLAVMLRFTVRVAVVFAIVALGVFASPLGRWFLDVVMGLPAAIAQTIQPALTLAFLMALVWSFSALSRGLLSRVRVTGSVAISGVMRVVVVVAIGSVALAIGQVNGAVLGMLCLIGAFGAELVVLGSRVLLLRKQRGGRLFPRAAPQEAGEPAVAD